MMMRIGIIGVGKIASSLGTAAAIPALQALGDLGGRVVIGCANPTGIGPEGLGLVTDPDTSAVEIIDAVSGALIFKTPNQTGSEIMADAGAYHPRPTMFVTGGDAATKPVVMELVGELAFKAIGAGPRSAASF